MLNKYPVIPQHFILATKAFKQQTYLLEQSDLDATFSCIKAWEESDDPGTRVDRRLFAFFNSGEHSGASQPHRHVQFLPMEEMKGQADFKGQADSGNQWNVLADEIIKAPLALAGPEYHQDTRLPFSHFGVALPPNPSPEELHQMYLSLYCAAVKATQRYDETQPQEKVQSVKACEQDIEGHRAEISYNLALTKTAMILCPRRSEGSQLLLAQQLREIDEDVQDLGSIQLNGTILAGTLMVKAEAEWNELRANPGKLLDILRDVGVPWNNEGEGSDTRSAIGKL